MERAFLEAEGTPLAERLYAALVVRVRQLAGILIVRRNSGHNGVTDRFVEIAENPVSEARMMHLLQRLALEGSDNAQLLNLGAWELATRDLMLDEAVAMAGKAVELAPDDSNIRDTLAEALFRNGDIEGAIKQAWIALELDPENIHLQEQLERFSN